MRFDPQPKGLFGVWVTALLASVFILVHYWAIFQNLGSTKCLEPYRDGVKTVLNACYHAEHGKSTTWFDGMNYPYPEHIIAATELPGMAILMKWLYPYFPWLTDYAFGITHLLLLGCILLCPIFLHLIFRDLGLPNWYAVPVALGITFLAPQLHRFGPHLGLAPLCVIPALFYGLMRFERGAKWSGSLVVMSVIFLSSFFHFYFFAITIFSVSFYFFFSFLRSISFSRLWALAGHYLLMVGPPLLFFVKWLILNDPITDRNANPWGFFHYHAGKGSIFASLQMPYFKWINDHWIPFQKIGFEGWAYVGLVAGLMLLFLLLRWFFYLFKKPFLGFVPKEKRNFLMPLFLAGTVMAMLGCSQPFATKGFEFLLDYTGPLRQFRSTGRFAWVFYFSLNIVAFTAAFYLSKNWRSLKIKRAFLFLLPVVLLAEAFIFLHSGGHMYSPWKLRDIPELVEGGRFNELLDLDYGKYQALLSIPYFNVGCDDWNALGGGSVVQQSLAFTLQTGLPTTGAMLTRTSRGQAFRQMQMVTEPYRVPAIFSDYKNEKPLLMLFSAQSTKADSVRYLHLKNEESISLYKHERWELFEMDLGAFSRRIENRKQEIREAFQTDSLTSFGKFHSTEDTEDFFYLDFDQEKSGKIYLGNGAFQVPLNADKVLFDQALNPHFEAGQYHFLMWVNVEEEGFSNTIIRLDSENTGGGQKLLAQATVKHAAQVFDPKGWVMIDLPFLVDKNTEKIKATLLGKKGESRSIYVDEILVKPLHTHLYRSTGEVLWKDNRFYQNTISPNVPSVPSGQ